MMDLKLSAKVSVNATMNMHPQETFRFSLVNTNPPQSISSCTFHATSQPMRPL